jgi:predicted aspartyl protease
MHYSAFKWFHRAFLITTLVSLLHASLSFGMQLYRWTDEEGTVHMTEDPSTIPPQFRNQTQKKHLTPATESDPAMPAQPYSAAINTAKPSDGLKRFDIPFQGFEGTARRIIIPVTFNESITANLLVDTGAPGLMISPQLAEKLGLADEKETNLKITAGGIGGSVPALLAVVDSVRIGEATSEFLPATITPIPSEAFEGLVGMDFLANYRISIDNVRNVLTFEEMTTRQDRPGGHDEHWWRSNFRIIEHQKAELRRYLTSLQNTNTPSNETETMKQLAKSQYDAAEKLQSRLERYASDNAVPSDWRQ